MRTILFVVACDLDRDVNGEVVVGTETKIACDKAIELFNALKDPCYIVATAGEARKYDNVVMSLVMQKYMHERIGILKPIFSRCADTFNTDGEVKELVHYIRYLDHHCKVIICVKWWHALRTRALIWRRFQQAGLQRVPVTIVECDSKASRLTILKEFTLAWPLNFIRQLRELIFPKAKPWWI